MTTNNNMRRFRFIGDPSLYHRWNSLPEFDKVYSVDDYNKMWGNGDFDESFIDDLTDWIEVSQIDPKPLHKDTDLGYYSGLAMAGLMHSNLDSDGGYILSRDDLARESIGQAKELIKQLENEQ